MESAPSPPATPWYRDGLRFACTGCGACCHGPGYVWVDRAEIEALARFLELDGDAFGRRYLRRVDGRLALVDGPNEACIFWRDGCRVYAARPRQCRTFPFWSDNLRSKAAWNRVAAESPGVNQGRLYSRQEIEHLLVGVGAASDTADENPPRARGDESP
jgi:Fe-S-cluster containining protein